MEGIVDESGKKPAFSACVILSKYLLLCPDTCQYDTGWVFFKDFKTDIDIYTPSENIIKISIT